MTLAQTLSPTLTLHLAITLTLPLPLACSPSATGNPNPNPSHNPNPNPISTPSVLSERDWPVKDRDGLRLVHNWEAARSGGGADTSWGARRGAERPDGGPSPGAHWQQQQQQRWD